MKPQELRVGVRVRIVDSQRIPHFLGAEGTIERTYRASGRTVVHVRFDDGRWQLLWLREVQPLREKE